MDPDLLLALLGPEGAMALSQPPVQPSMLPQVPPVAVPPVPTPTTMPAAVPSGPMMARPPEPYMSQPMPPEGGGPATLGAALTPGGGDYGGNPWSRGGIADPNASRPGAVAGSDALLKSLRGVTAPAAPTPQKVSTPHAPTPVKLGQNSALIDLLSSLGIGPQQALPGLKLPSTLGQALGGR